MHPEPGTPDFIIADVTQYKSLRTPIEVFLKTIAIVHQPFNHSRQPASTSDRNTSYRSYLHTGSFLANLHEPQTIAMGTMSTPTILH